jgi:hypothetical protein
MFRLLAVAAIFDAAITILVPVFHWLSRTTKGTRSGATADAATRRESIDQEIAQLKQRLVELERERAMV